MLSHRFIWALGSLIFAAIFPFKSNAMDLRIDTDQTGGKIARLSGPIEVGDAEKLAKFLILHRVTSFHLNSPGGDVVEAIRIAEILRTIRAITWVEGTGSCASACFFVWLGGALRIALPPNNVKFVGPVGLHRPYLVSPQNSGQSLTAQTAVMRHVTEHLEINHVPRRLIDVMMSRPSNDIYWMSIDDLTQVGSIPADLEELYISKCNFKDKSFEEFKASAPCIGRLNSSARVDGYRRLESGWRP